MSTSNKMWRRGGEFRSFDEWVNKAQSWLGPRHGIRRGTPVLCVDAKGRPCNVGYDFHRARDEGAFPVAFFIRDITIAEMYDEIKDRGPQPPEMAA